MIWLNLWQTFEMWKGLSSSASDVHNICHRGSVFQLGENSLRATVANAVVSHAKKIGKEISARTRAERRRAGRGGWQDCVHMSGRR